MRDKMMAMDEELVRSCSHPPDRDGRPGQVFLFPRFSSSAFKHAPHWEEAYRVSAYPLLFSSFLFRPILSSARGREAIVLGSRTTVALHGVRVKWHLHGNAMHSMIRYSRAEQ